MNDRTVLLSGQLVEYIRRDGPVYRWEGTLDAYDGERGLLMLDDGRRLTVVVNGPMLQRVDPATGKGEPEQAEVPTPLPAPPVIGG